MSKDIHISLNSMDYSTLVNGGVVKKAGVQIILEDIGFGVMEGLLKQAKEKSTFYISEGLYKMINSKIEGTLKEGDMVFYIPYNGAKPDQYQNGLVKKDKGDGSAFVVFNCNDDWNNFKDYTGQSTSIADLRRGWVIIEKREDGIVCNSTQYKTWEDNS